MSLTNCCTSTTIRLIETKEDPTSEAGAKLHNRIAVLRAERGLSRQQLAEAVGVNYQTIGYLERGDYNPSLALAFRLSEVFGLPIEAIFSPRPMKPMSESLYVHTREEEVG